MSGTCDAGHYCPAGTQSPVANPCAAGSYSPLTNLTVQSDCLPCTLGHNCPAGSSIPTACVAGTYTAVESTAAATDCLQCPAGNWCQTGSTIDGLACEAGSFSPPGASVCSTCQVGYYCDENATTQSDMLSTKPCPAGLYCPTGLDVEPSGALHSCARGYFCVQSTAAPAPCAVGTYGPVVALVNQVRAWAPLLVPPLLLG